MALDIHNPDSSKFSMKGFTDGLPENKVEVLMFGGRFLINNPKIQQFYPNGRPISIRQEVIREHVRTGQLIVLEPDKLPEETKRFLGINEN